MNSFFDDGTGVQAAQTIRTGEAIFVADGSFLSSSGAATAARVFGTPSFTLLGRGHSRVPGDTVDNDSTRAEIFGLILSVFMLQALCDLHDITDEQVHLACDNDVVIYFGIINTVYPRATMKHFDLPV